MTPSRFQYATLLIRLFVCSVIALSIHQRAEGGFTAAAIAEVNLLDGPNTDITNTPFGDASAIAQAGGAKAEAGTFYDIRLRAGADSTNFSLLNGAGSDATFFSGFSVLGTPTVFNGTLTFNFSFTAQITASSDATPGSLGTSLATYDIQTPGNDSKGAARLQSYQGVPLAPFVTGAFQQGTLVTNGNTISLSLSASIPYTATITGGASTIDLDLGADASADAGAAAHVDMLHSLHLDSITVPADFNSFDLSGVHVVFDSGLDIPVTRAVPEPNSVLLFALCGLLASTFIAVKRVKTSVGLFFLRRRG